MDPAAGVGGLGGGLPAGAQPPPLQPGQAVVGAQGAPVAPARQLGVQEVGVRRNPLEWAREVVLDMTAGRQGGPLDISTPDGLREALALDLTLSTNLQGPNQPPIEFAEHTYEDNPEVMRERYLAVELLWTVSIQGGQPPSTTQKLRLPSKFQIRDTDDLKTIEDNKHRLLAIAAGFQDFVTMRLQPVNYQNDHVAMAADIKKSMYVMLFVPELQEDESGHVYAVRTQSLDTYRHSKLGNQPPAGTESVFTDLRKPSGAGAAPVEFSARAQHLKGQRTRDEELRILAQRGTATQVALWKRNYKHRDAIYDEEIDGGEFQQRLRLAATEPNYLNPEEVGVVIMQEIALHDHAFENSAKAFEGDEFEAFATLEAQIKKKSDVCRKLEAEVNVLTQKQHRSARENKKLDSKRQELQQKQLGTVDDTRLWERQCPKYHHALGEMRNRLAKLNLLYDRLALVVAEPQIANANDPKHQAQPIRMKEVAKDREAKLKHINDSIANINKQWNQRGVLERLKRKIKPRHGG